MSEISQNSTPKPVSDVPLEGPDQAEKSDAVREEEELQEDRASDNITSGRIAEKIEMLNLYSGDSFTPESALSITRSRNTRFIVLAGPIESGKTTLLASIYDIFQKRLFANYFFAGSQTLLGFERRCHDSRLASHRTTPTTDRTKHEGKYRLLHLRVRKKDLDTPPQDLLFTDLSGELFKEIRDSTEECKRHQIFLRADHFVLFLDGKKLCDLYQRDKVVSDASTLLRRCLDANILGKYSLVDVLFAKWDLLKTAADQDSSTETFLQTVQLQKFEEPFRSKLGRMRCSRVAARPDPSKHSGIEFGYGLSTLFQSWVEESPSSRILTCRPQLRTPVVRQIDRYYLSCGGLGQR